MYAERENLLSVSSTKDVSKLHEAIKAEREKMQGLISNLSAQKVQLREWFTFLEGLKERL